MRGGGEESRKEIGIHLCEGKHLRDIKEARPISMTMERKASMEIDRSGDYREEDDNEDRWEVVARRARASSRRVQRKKFIEQKIHPKPPTQSRLL